MDLYDFILRAKATPYKHGGRDWDGFDCYGLCFLAWTEVYGFKPPILTGYQDARSFSAMRAVVRGQRTLKQLDSPALGDLILFNFENYHTGLYLGGREYLEIKGETKGAVIGDLFRLEKPGAVIGYYRPMQ